MLKMLLAGAAVAAGVIPGMTVQADAGTPAGFKPFTEWTRVDSQLADALAEGDAPNATTRHWERCAVHDAAKPFTVVCPDGYVTRTHGVGSHSHKEAFKWFGSWRPMSHSALRDLGWKFGMEYKNVGVSARGDVARDHLRDA